MSAVTIRRLTPLDTTAIAEVAGHLNREWGLSLGYSLSETLDWCRAVAAASDQGILVASENDALIGMVLVVDNDLETETELTPWLSALYVLPRARRRGVGSLLARAAVDFARRDGASTLYLYAASGPLFSYYSQLGWEELRPFVWQEAPYIILQKPLSD